MGVQAMTVAVTGMQACESLTHVIANNMSNFGTTAFKRDTVAFETLVYQSQKRVGLVSEEANVPCGVQVGLGVRVSSIYSIFDQGELKQTFDDLHLAIQGRGYFQVTLPDGTTAYTRAGGFKTNSDGKIVTDDGYVVGEGYTITGDYDSIQITPDGIITLVKPTDLGGPQNIGQIKLYSFLNEAGLKKLASNLYASTDSSGDPFEGLPGKNGLGSIEQGWLESSNSNPIRDIIDLIAAQRTYELCSKVIQTADEMLETTNNSKR